MAEGKVTVKFMADTSELEAALDRMADRATSIGEMGSQRGTSLTEDDVRRIVRDELRCDGTHGHRTSAGGLAELDCV